MMADECDSSGLVVIGNSRVIEGEVGPANRRNRIGRAFARPVLEKTGLVTNDREEKHAEEEQTCGGYGAKSLEMSWEWHTTDDQSLCPSLRDASLSYGRRPGLVIARLSCISLFSSSFHPSTSPAPYRHICSRSPSRNSAHQSQLPRNRHYPTAARPAPLHPTKALHHSHLSRRTDCCSRQQPA